MSIILFLIILFVLVLAHEWGHYITAKFFKMPVEEFGFGFPPRAMKLFKRGETLFTLNWLPLGGFVKITGEDPLGEKDDNPRLFSNQPWYAQAIVLCAGVFMNFILAWLLISGSYIAGSPTAYSEIKAENRATVVPELTIIQVLPDSPAENQGLLLGDVVTKVCNVSGSCPVNANATRDELISFIRATGESPLTFTVARQKEPKEIIVTPKVETDTAMIGVMVEQVALQKLPVGEALVEGFKATYSISYLIIKTFVNLITDTLHGTADIKNLTGPIGLVGSVGSAYDVGFGYLISLTALISLNLAVINLVPFPALDGGRLLIVILEAILRKKIAPKFIGALNTVGFFLLIGLMLLVSYHDVVRLIK